MPLVSVVMPVYNREQYLAAAIESILAQTFTDFEFIIVDDGSQDNSAQIIRSYATGDERIQYIRHETNLGHAAARNTGIAQAKGKYITGMDSDDISLPERLQKQVELLNAQPKVGSVGVSAQRVAEDMTPVSTMQLPPSNPLIILAMFIGGSAIVRPTIMSRREFLEAAGPYNPNLPVAADYELFLRLVWQTAIRYANVSDTLYLYRQHEGSISARRKDAQTQVRHESIRQAFMQLWGEAPEETLQRLEKLRAWQKLNWVERRATKRDLLRLIESMIAHNWVDAVDRPLLLATMNRRLEETTPRRWQQFCHWRRHRFPRFFPDSLQDQQ